MIFLPYFPFHGYLLSWLSPPSPWMTDRFLSVWLPALPLLLCATLHTATVFLSLKHYFHMSLRNSKVFGGCLCPSFCLEFRILFNEVPVCLYGFIFEPAQETHVTKPTNMRFSPSIAFTQAFPSTERLFYSSPNPNKVMDDVSSPLGGLPLPPYPSVLSPSSLFQGPWPFI